jgi:hypothetical protein
MKKLRKAAAATLKFLDENGKVTFSLPGGRAKEEEK